MVRACRPPAREPIESLVRAPLDDGDVDARQRQLARQHHPRRTSSGNHHRMFQTDSMLRGSLLLASVGYIMRYPSVLLQGPRYALILAVERQGISAWSAR